MVSVFAIKLELKPCLKNVIFGDLVPNLGLNLVRMVKSGYLHFSFEFWCHIIGFDVAFIFLIKSKLKFYIVGDPGPKFGVDLGQQ